MTPLLPLVLVGLVASETLELPNPAAEGSAQPGLVLGANGELVLSWVEPAGEDAHRLRFARLEEEGWSEARTIAEGRAWFVNWADVPAVAALADGTLAAHWLRKTDDATYAYEVLFALSWDGGASWSTPRRLHDDPEHAEHGFVSWAPRGDRFVALWLNGPALEGGHGGHHGETALHAREVRRDGTLGEERVIDRRACDCCATALVPVAGGALAVWRDRDAGEVRDLAFATLGEDGWTAPATVHADGWLIPGCPVNGPSLAARGGELACAWFTAVPSGRVLVASREGAGFGPPLRVDEGAPEGRAQVAFARDGSLWVLWLEVETPGAAWRLRRVGSSESVALARVPSGRASGFARLALHPTEDAFVVAWTEPGPAGGVRTLVATPARLEGEKSTGAGFRPPTREE